MKHMGYDLVALGNHEFDFGPAELAKILSKSAEQPVPGLVLSNIKFDSVNTGDDSLEGLFKSGLIAPYRIINRNGLKTGFFALMGVDAASVAPMAKPAGFTDRIAKATEMVDKLRNEEKCDIVICISHSGLVPDGKGGWAGDDIELAGQVPGIDVILSGHTHTRLDKPLIVNNIPIVQAESEGRFVGRLEIEKTSSGVSVISGELIPVDDRIQGDAAIQRMIAEQQQLIGNELFAGYPFDMARPVAEAAFPLRFNSYSILQTSNLGPFVADAIYDYVKRIDPRPTDVVMISAGLVRDEIIPGKTGRQLPADLFRILPLGMSEKDGSAGYAICKIFVTGKELKSILEAMQLAEKMSSDYYAYWSGMKFKMNSLRIPLDRVYEVKLGNDTDGYQKIKLGKNPERLYGVVTNEYVMKFFGVIKKSTMGLLSVVPKLADGTPVTDFSLTRIDRDLSTPGIQEAKEWAGLLDYASRLPDLNGNGIPDIPEKYREVKKSSEKRASINPILCFKATNGINLIPAALELLVLAGAALIIF
jgi:5'-nucleotidase